MPDIQASQQLQIPQKLRQRPRFRGLPIPFTTFMNEDGTPDFRVLDEYNRLLCIERCLCALCGQGLRHGKPMVFIGGENCCTHGKFLDPPMHVDCALYAAAACPFLSGDQTYRTGQHKGAVGVYPGASAERPVRMGLYYCLGYRPVNLSGQGICIQAGLSQRIDWDIIKVQPTSTVPIAAPVDEVTQTPATPADFAPSPPGLVES